MLHLREHEAYGWRAQSTQEGRLTTQRCERRKRWQRKPKGKADDGKGKPVLKQVGEATETGKKEGRELKPHGSDPTKEPDAEPQRQLTDFERTVVKALSREKRENQQRSIAKMKISKHL